MIILIVDESIVVASIIAIVEASRDRDESSY
jgi:hypothetical protein